MSRKLMNPIIPGYYPDPSICRVGEDYYIACSSFEMNPGLPIFHSKDMTNWEQIGNAITEENGFHMERNCGVGGLMAPTLRFHDGTFYIINANFADKGNYIITAKDPAGPWSEPHWMEDVPGIDASLFFDTDGQAYVVGTGDVWDNGAGKMERGIWVAKYNIEEFHLEGEKFVIFNSALRHGSAPEAPHLYHIGDYYYLIIAEGGTEHYHAVMCARSRCLTDFFEGNPANPVMTHRNLGFGADIINVGHADLVELPDGSWYAVMLGSRLIDKKCKNIGRETFICPVVWERDWPLFSPETGKIEWEYDRPNLPLSPVKAESHFDDFDGEKLPMHMVTWGTPSQKFYKISDSKLKIKCISQKLDKELEPMKMDGNLHDDWYCAFVARRQREKHVAISTKMKFSPSTQESAGIAIVQAMNHQIQFERVIEDGKQYLQLALITADYNRPPYFPGFEAKTSRKIVKRIPCDLEELILSADLDGENFVFSYGENENFLSEMGFVDGSIINPEKVGCMCGTLMGMFATGNGADSDIEAEFDWFSYQEF